MIQTFIWCLPLDEVIGQCIWIKCPIVSVVCRSHLHHIFTRCIYFLNCTPCRKKVKSSSTVDFYCMLEMWHHQLIDWVQLAELTICCDDYRLCHCMTPCAGQQQTGWVLVVKTKSTLKCKLKAWMGDFWHEGWGISTIWQEGSHSQVINGLMHSHFIAGGVSLGKLKQMIWFGGVSWGGKHPRDLFSTRSLWGTSQLNRKHFECSITWQEKQWSTGVLFTIL